MQRPSLLGTYKNQLKAYLRLKYKVDEAKAEELALEICRKHYRPLTAIIEETKVDNHPVIKGVDLATWFDAQRDNLITPSGSVYMQQEKKLGTIIEMVKKFLAQRSKEKKLMLKAKAAGDKTEQLKHYYAQTLIKIFVNALPGNYGSKYSIFYDKGNYNAITSAGRALIGFAYSEIEAVLGGNFMWLTIDDLKNHILTQIYAGIDEDKVEKVMAKFHLHRVTKDDLYAFYKKELSIYNHYTWYEDEKVNGKTIEHAAYIGHKEGDYAKVMEMVNLLNDTQVQYLYYFENLRHIIMENDAEFRSRFQNMFNYDLVKQDDSVQPDELFKIDGALVNMVNVAFSKYLQSGDSKVQVYDFPSKRPELAKRFINIARHVGDGGTPFPGALPSESACDFDTVKNLVCKYRAGNLKSVDAVLPGKDGCIYFVEFKDVSANPIADLKKKAFDSLPVFWVSLGRRMSMRDICAKAIFVYVKPDSEKELPVSDLLAEKIFFVEDAASLVPPKSYHGGSTLNLRLDELRKDGLYHDVIIETAGDFCKNYDERFGRCEKDDFRCRLNKCIGNSNGRSFQVNDGAMALNRILTASRMKHGYVSNGDFCDDDIIAVDFGRIAGEWLAKREYDHENAETQGRGTYYCADALMPESEMMYAYHNWDVRYPIATLVNKAFDTFLLWAWIYHSNLTIEMLVCRLGFVVVYDGDCPKFERHKTQKWLQQFYDVYASWFNGSYVDKRNAPLRYGLACYRDALEFYGDVSTLSVADCSSMLQTGCS